MHWDKILSFYFQFGRFLVGPLILLNEASKVVIKAVHWNKSIILCKGNNFSSYQILIRNLEILKSNHYIILKIF